MRFPRTCRLDDSDDHAFPAAARAGEWAISGGFVFAEREPALLTGRAGEAFAHGFLGTDSFGWSRLVEIVDIGAEAFDAVIEALARHLRVAYGAPDLAAARAVAREEAEFAAASLGAAPAGTLVAVDRAWGPQGITERFRTVAAPDR
jgi:hypothetical protein